MEQINVNRNLVRIMLIIGGSLKELLFVFTSTTATIIVNILILVLLLLTGLLIGIWGFIFVLLLFLYILWWSFKNEDARLVIASTILPFFLLSLAAAIGEALSRG